MNLDYLFKTFLWILLKSKIVAAFWRCNVRSLSTLTRNCRTESSIQDYHQCISERKFHKSRINHQSLNNIRRSANDIFTRRNETTHKINVSSYPITTKKYVKLDKIVGSKRENNFRHSTAVDKSVEHKTENFINKFKTASSKSSRLSMNDKKSLLIELQDWLPLLSVADVLKLMSYLHHFNFPPRSKDILEINDKILEKLDSMANSIGSKDMSQALSGLAKLGIRFTDKKHKLSLNRASIAHSKNVVAVSNTVARKRYDFLSQPNQARQTIFDVLPRTMSMMDAFHLSTSLWALGKLGFLWDDLSFDMQRTVFQGVLRCESLMTSICVANTIHGLSNMRLKWTSMPISVQTSIISALQNTINKMNEQEASNTISGLGRLEVSWNSLPQSLRQAIGEAFLSYLPVLGPKGLAMSVHGLGRMSADISTLPSQFRENIMIATCNISSVFNAQEVANTLYGLGKIGTNFPDLSTYQGRLLFKENSGNKYLTKCAAVQLMKAFTREAWQMSAQGISNSLWGLMLMQAHWTIFTGSQKNAIMQTLSRELCNMDEQQMANTIYSLGSMGMTWNSLKDHEVQLVDSSEETAEDLQENLIFALGETTSHMVPAGVVMTMIGLGKMGASWKTLPPHLKSRISDALVRVLRSASNRTVSAIIFALTVFEIRWGDLGEKVQTAIRESIGRSYWDSVDFMSSSEGGGAQLVQNTSLIDSILYDTTTKKAAVPRQVPAPKYIEPQSSLELDARITNSREQHLVYTLGILDVTWDELGISAQRSICNSLKYRLFNMDEQGVVNSLYGFSCMGVKWNQLDDSLKAALLEALRRVSDSMGEQGVAVTVLSLAKLDVCWSDDLSEPMKNAIRKAIAKQSHIGEHALSSLLYGLGKLSRKWTDLHPDVRLALKMSIVVCHLNDKCTPQGVANSLYGLAQMQTEWSSLSSSIHLALFAEVAKSIKTATETQLSNMVSSLGKMGVQWQQLPHNLQKEILAEIGLKSNIMNEQHLSNLLFALGSMGLTWESLSKALKVSLMAGLYRVNFDRDSFKPKASYSDQNASTMHSGYSRKWVSKKKTGVDEFNILFSRNGLVLKDEVPSDIFVSTSIPKGLKGDVSELMNAQGFSMSIVGLCKLGATWTTLPEHFIKVVQVSLLRLVAKMNSAQLSSVLSSLSKMNWRWENLDQDLQQELLLSVSNISSSCNFATVRDMSVIINSLGTLGLRWSGIASKAIVSSISNGISVTLRRGEREEVAGTIFGMAMMDIRWEGLTDSLRQDIVRNLRRLFSPNQTNESFMKARFDPQQSKTLHFAAMTKSQSLANIMYGIALLVFDTENNTLMHELDAVHVDLLNEVTKVGVGSFSEAEKEQVLIYMNLHITSASLDLAATSNRILLKADNNKEEKVSRLQHTVVSSLRDALQRRNRDLFVADEYSAFNGAFPVDATVFEGEIPVAFLEVDGPQHYRNGQLLRKDIMKEALYRRKHPCATFTRVRFDQVNKLGSKYVGREVADYITLTLHTCEVDPSLRMISPCEDAVLAMTRQVLDKVNSTSSTKPANNVKFGGGGCSASTSPLSADLQSCYTYGWVERRAARELQEALNRESPDLTGTRPRMCDFVFADVEEDNS